MACCGGEYKPPGDIEETHKSVRIEKEMLSDFVANKRLRVLFLGPGESGKTTFLKQLKQIYGSGWPEEERINYYRAVHNDVLNIIKTLIEESSGFDKGYDTEIAEYNKSSKDVLTQLFSSLDFDWLITPDIAKHISIIYNDAGIQNTLLLASRYQMPYAVEYLFSKLDEIAKPTYIPSTEDVMRVRVRTTGITTFKLTMDKKQFEMLDVGGQRSERRKWIHCFEGVNAVLYVGAISEYDQVLAEDSKTNRMHETLTLWGNVCNSEYFNDACMILFLNKTDLFVKKIVKVPITICFPDYPNNTDVHEAMSTQAFVEEHQKFLIEEFKARKKNPKQKIYIHFTCATNQRLVEDVFQSVNQLVITTGLERSNLM